LPNKAIRLNNKNNAHNHIYAPNVNFFLPRLNKARGADTNMSGKSIAIVALPSINETSVASCPSLIVISVDVKYVTAKLTINIIIRFIFRVLLMRRPLTAY
jgi:hypothetical protein